MSLKGNLQSVDLANVLQMLSMNQKEGTLVLFDGDTRKSIYFSRDGVSMLSRGRRGTDSLGRILLRHGRVTPEQLQAALDAQVSEGKRLGQILMEMGAAAAEDIEQAVRTQIEEEIYNLFIWKEASFEFIEGPPPAESGSPTRVTFDVDSLVAEAQRRAEEWNYIRGLVPSLDEIYRPTEGFDGAKMEDPVFGLPFAARILESLRKGRLNVSEMIDASHAAKFEVCKILAVLLEQGAIEPVSMADLQTMATEASGQGSHPQAAKFLLRIADLGGATPAVNMNLGYALEAMDEPERASVYLKNAAEAYEEMVEPGHAFEAWSRVARALPTDLQAVTRCVEIACGDPGILSANREEILGMGRTLSLCLKELGRLPATLQIIHNLAQNAPEDLELRGMLVQAYVDSGMNAEAVSELERMSATCEARQNYDEAIRLLRRASTLDRTREGLLKRVEVLTRARDRNKRLYIKLGVGAAILLAAGGVLWGIQYAKQQRLDNEERVGRIVETGLSPLVKRFEEANAKFSSAAEALRKFEDLSSAEVGARVADLKTGAEGMETAAAEHESKCSALFQEHREFLSPTFAVTKPRPMRDKANDARRQQGILFDDIAQKARELARETREVANDSPSRALPGAERTVALLEAVGSPTAYEEDGRSVDLGKFLKTLRDYGGMVRTAQERADRLFEEGNPARARDVLAKFVGTYFTVREFAETIRFQVRVTTTPRGARIRVIDGAAPGTEGKAPMAVGYTVAGGLRIVVSAEGFQDREARIPPPPAPYDPDDLSRTLPAELRVTLDKVPVWSASLDTGGLEALPVAVPGGEHLVVPDRGGRIHLIASETGKRRLYDARSISGFRATPVATADSVYAASVDGIVVALDLPSLRERWRKDAREGPGPVYGTPVLVGDLLVVAGEGGTVVGLDARSGEERWRTALKRGTRMPLLLVRGWILAYCEDGILRTLSPDGKEAVEVLPTGERRPSYPPPGTPPLAVKEKVLVGMTGRGAGFSLIELPPPGAVSPHVGFRWGVTNEDASVQGAALDGEDLVLLFSDGSLRRLPSASRQVPKEGDHASPALDPEERVVGAPAPAGGVVFVAHRNGLAAFSSSGGGWEPLWRWAVPLDHNLATGPVLVGRMVVVCSGEGTIYALLRE